MGKQTCEKTGKAIREIEVKGEKKSRWWWGSHLAQWLKGRPGFFALVLSLLDLHRTCDVQV